MSGLRHRLRQIVEAPPANLWWWLLVLLSALIFLQSGRPLPELVETRIPFQDKLLHFGAFGVWTTLCLAGLAESGVSGRGRRALLAIAAATLFGASDEIHQAFVPARSAELLDWAADTCGALAASGLWLLLERSGSQSGSSE